MCLIYQISSDYVSVKLIYLIEIQILNVPLKFIALDLKLY